MASSKGKNNLILVEGHTFSVQGGNPSTYYCSRKTKTGCKARVGLRDEVIVSYEPLHNHPPPRIHMASDGSVYRI
ncbi:unnamed protein product, partial [Iphiclides podalirius]